MTKLKKLMIFPCSVLSRFKSRTNEDDCLIIPDRAFLFLLYFFLSLAFFFFSFFYSFYLFFFFFFFFIKTSEWKERRKKHKASSFFFRGTWRVIAEIDEVIQGRMGVRIA